MRGGKLLVASGKIYKGEVIMALPLGGVSMRPSWLKGEEVQFRSMAEAQVYIDAACTYFKRAAELVNVLGRS